MLARLAFVMGILLGVGVPIPLLRRLARDLVFVFVVGWPGFCCLLGI